MRFFKFLFAVFFFFCFSIGGYADIKKTRIFVVSSYHREYLWTQDTNEGVCAALLDFKFLDNKAQTDEYTQNDFVETQKTVIKKAWMDTKRKSSKGEMAQETARVIEEIKEFKPDLILLGDDNAANYIGNQFIDMEIPIVFWGVNINPLKYGLIDSMDSPGHNVTGVYQTGYPKECLEYLKKLVPTANTFALIADDSETARAKSKEFKSLADEGKLPLELIGTVITNSFSDWKAGILSLKDKADVFFVINHNTLKDEQGHPVDPFQAMAWYLENINKPDTSDEKQFVQEGTLITADDSGFKQGYEAVRMVHQILHEGKSPSTIQVMTPTRGKIIVNRQRAAMLGIDLSGKGFIEQYEDKVMALEKYPTSK